MLCEDESRVLCENNTSLFSLNTAFVCIPVLSTLILGTILALQAKSAIKTTDPLPCTSLFRLKIATTAAIALISGAKLSIPLYDIKNVGPILFILSFVFATFLHYTRQKSGIVTSGPQHISAFIFLIFVIAEFYNQLTSIGRSYSITVPDVLLHFTYTILLCFADKRAPGTQKHPESDSSFLSQLLFNYFNEIPRIAQQRALELKDLFFLERRYTSAYLLKEWENQWNRRLKEYQSAKEAWRKKNEDEEIPLPLPSVARSLFQIFKWDIVSTVFYNTTNVMLRFTKPFLLSAIISYVSSNDSTFSEGIFYALLIILTLQIGTFFESQYFYAMGRMGAGLQSLLYNAIYSKTISLSTAAKKEKSVGEIINFLASDVETIKMIAPQLQNIWACSFQIAVSVIYLYVTLGFAFIPGLIIMLIFIPLSATKSKFVKQWQEEKMKLKDQRARMVNEVFSGIKVIKLYAWELAMEARINDVRNKELNLFKKSSSIESIFDTISYVCPFLVALLSFATYVTHSSDHKLTPQLAFVSITLFKFLWAPLNLMSFYVTQTMMLMVSNERLKSFFSAEEWDETSIESIPEASEIAIKFNDFSGSWNSASEKPTLSNINWNINRGTFVAVVGKVGSGKSSLLSSILGEMGKLSGTIGRQGSVSYVPQQPWILNMSVRDNILLNKPYCQKFYNQVITVCCLKQDILMLPHGDETEIGEKGVNLSGGQKSRLALARAIYQNSDVYLLDDPLSAVDAHVGKRILQEALGPDGILRDKTRILVSHNPSYVKQADEIVVLDEGEIIERGRFEELVRRKGHFSKFWELMAHKTQETEDASFESDESEEEFQKIPRQISDDTGFSKQSKESEQLIKDETVTTGWVKWSVYLLFFRAATYSRAILFVLTTVFYFGLLSLRNFWLSSWSEDAAGNSTAESYQWRLSVYAGIGGAESLVFFVSLQFLTEATISAAKNLHSPLIHNLLRSPLEFFDRTPIGRILCRCTNDMSVVDFALPFTFKLLLTSLLRIVFAIIAIVFTAPLTIFPVLSLGYVCLSVFKFVVPTSRQLQRLDGTFQSPLFSKLTETANGVSSIRSFKKEEDFRISFGLAMDKLSQCKYTGKVSEQWMATRLISFGNLIVFFTVLLTVIAKEFWNVGSPGLVGISISSALNISDALIVAVRQICFIESNIIAVERIEEFTTSPNEAPWEMSSSSTPKVWPHTGRISFTNYSMSYRKDLDPALKGLTLEIKAGEKIGIVGRTGAGKSSFALALFRIMEACEGSIEIDGVDISELGLHDLRSKLTIIPQDPVLFSGSIRFNLDPEDNYSSEELDKAIELAHLKAFINSFSQGKDENISEGGENFSVGQRQLICLARAILRKSKILILDEATAAVDVATDDLIQKTIREQFSSCTVLTIAHRINTVLDYDKILVLDHGEMCELAPPSVLLRDPNSMFSKLLVESKTHDIMNTQ